MFQGTLGAQTTSFFKLQPMEWRVLRHVTESSDGSSRRRAEIASSVGLVLGPWQRQKDGKFLPRVPSPVQVQGPLQAETGGVLLGVRVHSPDSAQSCQPSANESWVGSLMGVGLWWIAPALYPSMMEAGCWMA